MAVLCQFGELPAKHRASRCALEARRMAIALPGELQESEGPCTNQALRAVRGRSVAGRLSSCKTSRESICPGALSRGVRGARWTQIDAIARVDVPCSDVWRGWRRSMDTNQCHHAGGCSLEGPGRPIRVPDELQESEGPCTNRALRALCGSSMSFGDLPAKHRASGYALECCLEGFAALDGHKSMPSRRRMCPVGP